jgi:hypothetical protein
MVTDISKLAYLANEAARISTSDECSQAVLLFSEPQILTPRQVGLSETEEPTGIVSALFLGCLNVSRARGVQKG